MNGRQRCSTPPRVMEGPGPDAHANGDRLPWHGDPREHTMMRPTTGRIGQRTSHRIVELQIPPVPARQIDDVPPDFAIAAPHTAGIGEEARRCALDETEPCLGRKEAIAHRSRQRRRDGVDERLDAIAQSGTAEQTAQFGSLEAIAPEVVLAVRRGGRDADEPGHGPRRQPTRESGLNR